MLFNSFEFILFFIISFILYWYVFNRSIKTQNFYILVISYIFYGWWDWRFLILLFLSTLGDFIIGNLIYEQSNNRKRKLLLYASLVLNLGVLSFFKYFNFFIESVSELLINIGMQPNLTSLEIILPVGISFYTFQTLSYTIDVYRKDLIPTKDIIAFSSFVSFFPQLVAGPIERASNLLPQFYRSRKFDYAKSVDGLKQILWGFFKKLVIADNCAELVNYIYNNHDTLSGGSLLIGAILFSFQIYGDFSGYSDIAIGTSKLFGFELKKNFAFPYFSRDIAEFWRRWHISLSTWFRDYLYIPLGGSQKGRMISIINTLIIFIVSGFWHGANWTFIFWGLVNALLFLPLLLKGKNRNNLNTIAENGIFPSFKELFQMGVTFFLVVNAWIFFRSESLNQAFSIFKSMYSSTIFNFAMPKLNREVLLIAILIAFFLVIEWLGRKNDFALEKILVNRSRLLRWGTYMFILFLIGMFMQTNETPFIYFQF